MNQTESVWLCIVLFLKFLSFKNFRNKMLKIKIYEKLNYIQNGLRYLIRVWVNIHIYRSVCVYIYKAKTVGKTLEYLPEFKAKWSYYAPRSRQRPGSPEISKSLSLTTFLWDMVTKVIQLPRALSFCTCLSAPNSPSIFLKWVPVLTERHMNF